MRIAREASSGSMTSSLIVLIGLMIVAALLSTRLRESGRIAGDYPTAGDHPVAGELEAGDSEIGQPHAQRLLPDATHQRDCSVERI